jgi:hypothetical protein
MPNSWAAISMWRRFFKMQEEEEQERIDQIVSALDEKPPVQSERAKEQMNEFRRSTNDRYQQQQRQGTSGNAAPHPPISLSRSTVPNPTSAHQNYVRQHEQRVLTNPNLSVGPDSMYLAQ